METLRQTKVGRLLQKEIGLLLQSEGKEYTAGAMLSVTVVRVTPDLGYAKIYMSVFPSESSDAAVKNLNSAVKSIRYLLGKRVRHQLRIVPELVFFVDDSLDYADKIDNLLNN